MICNPGQHGIARDIRQSRNVRSHWDSFDRWFRTHGLARVFGFDGALLFHLGHQRCDLFLVAGLRWFGDDLADGHLRGHRKTRGHFVIGVRLFNLGQTGFSVVQCREMQPVQHRVRQQHSDDLVAPLRVAQHGVVAHLVAVLQRPIVGIVLVFLVVDVAAQFAQRIAVNRFHGIMVQLYPVITDGAGDGSPATELEIILHDVARPGQPFHLIGKRGLDVAGFHLGPMDAQFPIVGVKFEQGFHAPPLVPGWRGGHQVLFGHGITRPVHHAPRPKDPPRHHDAIGILRPGRRDQIVQRAIAIADRHELIGVKHHDPVRILYHRFVLRMVQRRGLRAQAVRNHIAAVMGQTQLLQPDQHVIGAVRTIVRIDQQV